MYLDDGGRRRYVHTDTGDEQFYSDRQPGLQLEDGNWSEDYNYIRPRQSSIRDDAYRAWYETTHPRPYTLNGAIEYWINRRKQLQRCQANHPLSYEAFLRANQPAEGHPADDTWDYGQLFRLHMIRAQAAQDLKSFDITEDDIENYLIRTALADNQLDTDATSSSSIDQRRVPGGKRTTTDEENIFFQRSLRTPRPTAGVTLNANIEPRRRRRPSSSVSTRTSSTSGTYPESWTPERRSQLYQRAQSARCPTLTSVVMLHRALQSSTGTTSLKQSSAWSISDTTKSKSPRTTVQQPSSAWTRSLRMDTPSHSPRLKRSSQTKRDATDFSTTAQKDRENGQCPWKPWRTLLYSARTSHCLAGNLDNYRTSTGTRRRNHRGSSSVTCVAAAYMSALPPDGAAGYFAYTSE